MTITPIRTNKDYEAALARASELITLTSQTAIDELDVLQTLIEKWERSIYQFESVSPADAIKFRMQQLGLKPRDLEPYLGPKSRVSEILNGQRQPTVDQIRALHMHLRIPIELLIGVIKHEPSGRPEPSASAMEKLRSFGVMLANETYAAFIGRAKSLSPAVSMLRKSRTERTNAKTDFAALEGWCAAVMVKASEVTISAGAAPDDERSARKLAMISREADWPTRVVEYLASIGIVLVFLDHLPGTFLDGAAMRRADGVPVIAMTMRHDRLDNFWFTLLHEYAHVVLHLNSELPLILDDLDVNSTDGVEAQADEFARNALIPMSIWSGSGSLSLSKSDLEIVAEAAGVHPAIVAGRWRFEHSDYRKFSRLIGRGEVRKRF
ncbi:helix-turn-helix domain-containing protein [Hoeflea alexandrii]|uniref:helix-turn-helix domain-containing protein n=1 Tax=Hoeflea alexandrii TaxID=288436 RepID=UPI00361A6C24